ncbi:MAG: ABC transporter ATP-binding protein [Alkaliphilus sp.]
MRVFIKDLKEDFDTSIRYINLLKKTAKDYRVLVLISALLHTFTPLINIVGPRFIIDELLGNRNAKNIFMYVAFIIVTNLILGLLTTKINNKLIIRNRMIKNEIELNTGEKIMGMSFENLEDPQVLDFQSRAFQPMENQQVLFRLNQGFVTLTNSLFILVSLFFLIISINYFVFIFICLTTLLLIVFQSKEQKTSYKFQNDSVSVNRVYMYYMFGLQDFSYGKDIRLYDMEPLITKRAHEFNNKAMGMLANMYSSIGKYKAVNEIITRLQVILVYSYMTYQVLVKGLGIGAFTMYITAINVFSNSFREFISALIEIRSMLRYIRTYFEFIDRAKNDEKKGGILIREIESIEFRDVWFKYPRAENYVLKDINVKIDKGETIAIVGDNGAGKTTFVKLLTGLYEPSKGKILINGVNLEKLDYKQYINQLGVVFQDYRLFSFSIKENIALKDSEHLVEERMSYALSVVQMEGKISALPKGLNTTLYRTFEESGVELSGGECQKIAIARAAYRVNSLMVLDEPTASLDPIAEHEIYQNLKQLSKNKSTVFISHRMSSCLFCDNIILFDYGQIKEIGTHSILMRKKGLYYKMFNAQAQFYNTNNSTIKQVIIK